MGVTTDVAAMNKSAGHVDDVNHNLSDAVNKLRGHVDSVRGSFEGQAAVKFHELMERYNDASVRLNSALGEIAVKIRENGKGYDDAEEMNSQTFASVGNSGSLDIRA